VRLRIELSISNCTLATKEATPGPQNFTRGRGMTQVCFEVENGF